MDLGSNLISHRSSTTTTPDLIKLACRAMPTLSLIKPADRDFTHQYTLLRLSNPILMHNIVLGQMSVNER